MASERRTLYIGVTNDLERRVAEHKSKLLPGFTSKYNVTRLVYFEEFSDIRDAIIREKVLKGWTRKKKIELIEALNPKWIDLGVLRDDTAQSTLRSLHSAALRSG